MKTFAPEICSATERLHVSTFGGVVRCDRPLFYCEARWSTEAVVEITDLPAGLHLNTLAQQLVARGFEIFKHAQRKTYRELIA